MSPSPLYGEGEKGGEVYLKLQLPTKEEKMLDKMGYYSNIKKDITTICKTFKPSMRSIHINPRFGGILGIEGGVSMRSKVVILCMTGLLLLLGLNGAANGQLSDLAGKIDDDTIDIAIEYLTAYPGTVTWVEVFMRNPVPVSGFILLFQLSSIDPTRFSCDTSGQCFIDTGCSAGIFSYISCVCQENGGIVTIVALGDPGEFIPPSPDYLCLFKIRMDVCCIPDADTFRNTYILLSPGSSWVFDTLYNSLPLSYNPPGELFVWWSVPGDANGDSLVNIGDVLFLINYLYQEGAEPCVCEAADCNNDSAINVGDVIYLINYLFTGGPAPIPGSVSCWYEDCWP